MYKKTATHVTFNSLTAISKVRRSSCNSFDPVQICAFQRKYRSSSAVERSDFYYNPNGSNVNPENSSSEYNQQNPLGFNPKNVEFQLNTTSGYGKGWNFGGSNIEFPRYTGEDSRGNSVKNINQSPTQNLTGVSSANGFNGQRGSDSPGSVNRVWNENYGRYENGVSMGNDSGMFSQNSSNYDMHNTVISQKNLNNYHAESAGNSQQVQDNYYSGNAGTDLQNLTNGHMNENVGQYQQNVNGSYQGNTGQHRWDANERQSVIAGHQELNDSDRGGESGEVAQSGQLKGSVEELDEFCKEGKLKEAVEVLGLLKERCISVDIPRYLMLIKACGDTQSLEEGKSVHDHLVTSVLDVEVRTYNEILGMYSRCGSMDDAYMVFRQMPVRNLTSWDTMITWCARNGLGENALELFSEFKKSGLKPDGQMFIGVFSACSVVGDIDEGMYHFKSMSKDYGIVPSMKHYVSVVDMLGSTGYIDEALEFIEKMPVEPSVDIWETLMNLCRVHGNTELGDRCAELVEILDSTRLNEQSKAGLIPVRALDLAQEREKKKSAGQSLLEVRSRVHEYRAGDRSHPDSDKLYDLLRGMKQQMKEAGYMPETKFVLHDIDQESKEEALLGHSERLACAQGLLSSAARAPIRVIKNLRVCGDCHNALKIISKLVGRELIMRDAKRFHHFKDGICSCKDYW